MRTHFSFCFQPEQKTHDYLVAAAQDLSLLSESGVKGPNELMVFTQEDFDQGSGFVRDPLHVLKNTAFDMSALLSGREIPSDPLVRDRVQVDFSDFIIYIFFRNSFISHEKDQ
jgi:hypothetical protein